MRTNLTSLERLEAQIHTLKEGTPQGAAWEAALVRWVNAGGHPVPRTNGGRWWRRERDSNPRWGCPQTAFPIRP